MMTIMMVLAVKRNPFFYMVHPSEKITWKMFKKCCLFTRYKEEGKFKSLFDIK